MLVDTAEREFGGLHILVNVAGVFAPAAVTDMTEHEWERVIRVHLSGTFYNIQAAARVMIPARYGKIINTTSRTGLRGLPAGECNYAAAKAGIVGLTLSLAHELLPYRINVNGLSPVAWSRMAEELTADEQARARISRSNNVLARVGMPEDIVPTALFLASDQSAYLTGQVLQATGLPMSLL